MLVYGFENIIILAVKLIACIILQLPLCKKEWLMHTSRINYWSTDKLVCFLLSFVVFVTQQYKQRTVWKVSLQSIQPYNRKYVECACETHGQRLIIGKPISQYASYSAMFCPLYSNISKEQHEKYPCNPSSHNRKYGECAYKMCAPKINYWKTHKPVRFVLSYVCPLYSNMSKEQHEKHLCNPSSHYGKYGEYSTSETHSPFLDTWKP